MTIRTIQHSFSRELTNAYGLKQWIKFGVAGELEPMDNPEIEMEKLVSLVNKFHVTHSPDQEHMKGSVVTRLVDEPPGDKPTDIISQIGTCTEIKVLETYKLMVKGFPDRQAAYDAKMEELKKDLVNKE